MSTVKAKIPTRFHYRYDNLTAFVNEVKHVVDNKAFQPEYKASPSGLVYDTSEGWHGTKDINETFTMARFCWPKGRDKLVTALASASKALEDRPTFTMDVAGAYPDVPLYIAGDPACMVDLAPEDERKRPIVRLAINGSVSCAYGADKLTNYGAACLSYVDALENAGYRVELECLISCALNNSTSGKRYNLHVMAKQAHEHMDLDMLAFMFVQPSFFRRLVFCHMQSRTDLPKDSMSRCGTAASPVPGIDTDEGQLLIPGINTFAPSSPALASPKAAADALAPILEKLLMDAGMRPPSLAFSQDSLKG